MELENVKVGDKVIYSHYYHGDTIVKVEKVTKNYIIVKGNKYKKIDGSIASSNHWTLTRIRCAKNDNEFNKIINEQKRREIIRVIINKVNSGNLKKLSIEDLNKINDII